jgi:type VI secretion system protein ImpG
MDREFLSLYNQELAVLYEQAQDFAEAYPGIAERLGGITAERMDPMVGGLLEGAAFLAARVQLKLKHEFPEFTGNMLEMLAPNALAPTPSFLLARFMPNFGDPALLDGRMIDRGAACDAVYAERERRVSCRYTLCAPVTLWPLELTGAQYLPAVAAVAALGIPTSGDTASALRLSLRLRTTQDDAEELAHQDAIGKPEAAIAQCRIDELPIHLLGAENDAVALLELLLARRVGIHMRGTDEYGKPIVRRLPETALDQLGFDDGSSLLPVEHRLFSGFARLQELFSFPRHFLGFRLRNLQSALAAMPGNTVDIVITFSESVARLKAAIKKASFALYAAPAVNLFERTIDRVPAKSGQYEYPLIVSRTNATDFETHRVLDVFAHAQGGNKFRVSPLYAETMQSTAPSGVNYTTRRLKRLRSRREQDTGLPADYVGTETFLSLSSMTAPGGAPIVELSARVLTSNRHLPEHLPVGQAGADFRLAQDATLGVVAHFGPTKPRDPAVSSAADKREATDRGAVAWRLINMLALNHRGIATGDAAEAASMLRQVLTLFANPADAADERRIAGIRSVTSRSVVRRLAERIGVGVARGIEVAVTLDEKAFEGSGVFLLGTVLDRFFAEYASMNQFTQLVLSGNERGLIARFPARRGGRRLM